MASHSTRTVSEFLTLAGGVGGCLRCPDVAPQAKFELEVMGLNIKNERTNEPVSDFVDGSDTESTAFNHSSRSQSDSPAGGVSVTPLPHHPQESLEGSEVWLSWNRNSVAYRRQSPLCGQHGQ
eukprot:CAMPEP_0174361270 /NCGR_PEP_ID=MMETSP0811_2-20130205/58457_1 /TAXON_ID=73025 ORGANISM="Eutreptiella gymnastica-like, Strain CCMP1594" /NCGR_SAMPLE_ID=MMETSP0811_2 /ASSEMBLY_ACC=CAM_ASM_000667 /LENGTH=122 /DNA_ID=CAMNT_0015497779 /DNA_START=94 /DNA_END=463 /DNA_ORIENTATION=-